MEGVTTLVYTTPSNIMLHQRKSLYSPLIKQENSSNCTRVQDEYPELIDKIEVQVVFGILYSFVILFGLGGNCLVIYSIFCKGVQFNVRKVFIVSLALSDILIGLTSLPITAVSTFLRAWPFGMVLCRTLGSLPAWCIFASSFTLAAIAADRFVTINFPTSSLVTKQVIGRTVVAIWIFGFALASPLAVFSKLATIDAYCGSFCQEGWPTKKSRCIYGISTTLFQFCIPLVITTFCYIWIAVILHRQFERRCRHGNVLADTIERLNQKRRLTNRMTSLMVLSFMLAWLPMNVLNLARDFEECGFSSGFMNKLQEHFSLIFTSAHLFAMTSIIWNPMIYSWLHEPFRESIRNIVSFVAIWNQFQSAVSESIQIVREYSVGQKATTSATGRQIREKNQTDGVVEPLLENGKGPKLPPGQNFEEIELCPVISNAYAVEQCSYINR